MTEPRSPTTTEGRIREGVAAAREGTIVSVIVLVVLTLVINPGYIGRVAKEAGIRSAYGVEFRDQIEQGIKGTMAAKAAVIEIDKMLGRFNVEFQELSQQQQRRTTKPSQVDVKKLAELAKEVETLEQQNQTVKRSLENSLQAQQELLKSIPK